MATIDPDEKHRDLVDMVCGIVMEYFTENCIEWEPGLYAIMVDETVEKSEFHGLTGGDSMSIKELLPFDPQPWIEYTKAVLKDRGHGDLS